MTTSADARHAARRTRRRALVALTACLTTLLLSPVATGGAETTTEQLAPEQLQDAASLAQEAPSGAEPGSRPATATTAVEASSASSLSPVLTSYGRLSLSVDGLGTLDPAGGVVEVEKAAGATVRKAYLVAASTGLIGYTPVDGDVTINGAPVTWDPAFTTTNSIGSVNVLADVTAMVKTTIDAGAAGRIAVTVSEPANPYLIDGEILAVILDDPNVAADRTIILSYGAQAVGGDAFSIELAEPIDLADPDFFLTMGLGISFGHQPAAQYNQIDVNGQRLTTSAGGEDDGEAANGALLTVGGLDDSTANPLDPFATDSDSGCPRCDDELYDLVPFVADGDTTVNVATQNPSGDDNVFFVGLELGAKAVVVDGNVLVSPTQGPVGNDFVFTYSCPQGTTPRLTILDGTGQPVTRGFTIGIRVTGNGIDYVQSVTAYLAGTFSGAVTCSGEPAGSATFTVEGLRYVALGDSFSAGEGTYYYDDSRSGRECHRGPAAWPRQLERDASSLVSINHLACTGATTAHLLDPWGDKGEPAQIPDKPDPSVGLVTVTIGGNDLKFGRVLISCYAPGTGCDNVYTNGRHLQRLADLYETLVDEVYPALEAAYPNARIVHVGYPRLTPAPGVTTVRCPWLSRAEQVSADQIVRQLNTIIRTAAAQTDEVEYVDVFFALKGNELCTTNSWVHPINPAVYNNNTEQGHPTFYGQIAYEESVASALGIATIP